MKDDEEENIYINPEEQQEEKKSLGHFTITKKANRIPLPKLQECTKVFWIMPLMLLF
jgi:hypothetical protein